MTLNDLPLTHLSTLRATPHCSQDPRAAGPYRESSVIPIAHLTCSCSEPRKYWQSVIAPSTCCSVHAPQRDNFSRLSSPNRLPPVGATPCSARPARSRALRGVWTLT